MIFSTPKNPDGRTPEAIFDKRITDALTNQARPSDVQGMRVCRTTRGSYSLPEIMSGGGSSASRLRVYVLQDVFDDYLVCGPLPAIPLSPSGLGPARFIGSFGTSQFSGNDIIITVDPESKYTPVNNDVCWHTGAGKFKIFTGTEWVNMTQATTKTYVAKEPNARCSLKGEIILGVAHTYKYSAGPSEEWVVQATTHTNKTSFNKTRTDDDGSSTEDQRIVPPWVENEVIFAIPAVTGIKTEDTTPKTVSLMIVGRSAQWAGPTT